MNAAFREKWHGGAAADTAPESESTACLPCLLAPVNFFADMMHDVCCMLLSEASSVSLTYHPATQLVSQSVSQ